MHDKKYTKGVEKLNEVYAGLVQASAPGQSDFMDLMVSNLFGDIWCREALSIKERRLFVMGVLAALGEKDTYAIQCAAALKNQELNSEQIRELVIQATQYVGYPRASGLYAASETVIEQQSEND